MFSTSHLTKQNHACFVFLVWIGLFMLVACSVKPTPVSTLASTVTASLIPTQTIEPASTPTSFSEQAALTDIIQTILSEPKKQLGKEVVIVGYYRGWNLFGEASGRSPVTRSDWVIKDKSGSIYVQAGGKTDTNLSPGSLKDTNKLIRVTGFVRLTAEGQPYIEPVNIEILDK